LKIWPKLLSHIPMALELLATHQCDQTFTNAYKPKMLF
jgi:hypothetical protein